MGVIASAPAKIILSGQLARNMPNNLYSNQNPSQAEIKFLADALIQKLKGNSRPKLELIIGNSDRKKGAEEIAKALRHHIRLLPTRLIAKRWHRPKPTIIEWYRHYKIELPPRGKMGRAYKLVSSEAMHTLEGYEEWTHVNGLPVGTMKVGTA